MQSLIVERSDLEALLQEVGVDGLMDRLIAKLRAAIFNWDEESTRIQPRDGFAYEDPVYGLQEWMPICKVGDATLMKMVGYHPNNPAHHGIPTVLSTLSAYDTASGHLRAVVDGTLLTAMRTGAASALASEVLAQPNSRTVGLIGCGAQAVTQVHALSRIFPLTNVWGYDVNGEAAASLAARLEWLDLSVERVGFSDLKDRWGGNARPAYPSADPAYAYGKEHDLNKYVDFMTAQVTELLTNYGPIAAICLDGIATPLHDKKAGGKPMEICSTLQNKGWGFAKNSAHLKPAKARMKLATARKGGG